MYQTVRIVNKMNGMAITVSQGQYNTKPNSLIIQTYIKSQYQHFVIAPAGSNSFLIQPCTDMKKAIDVPGESKKQYVSMILWDKHSNNNQKWLLHHVKDNYYYIENLHSKKVLEIFGGIDAEGLDLVQNKLFHNKSQYWIFEKI